MAKKPRSDYLTPKKKVKKMLDQADIPTERKEDNQIDDISRQLDEQVEESHGITERIRNIFND